MAEDDLKSNKIIDKFKEIVNIKKGNKKAAIFTHPCPDPDALGSMLGLSWLLKRGYDIDADCFYSGHISHPQNIAFCNLLDTNLLEMEAYDDKEYALRLLVDTVPVNSVLSPEVIDIVIDHHKETPNGGFKGLFINFKSGSCCATIYDLIKQHKLQFEDANDLDIRVATAISVGIITDTAYLTSDDTSQYEFTAYPELFEFRNPTAIKDICNYKISKFWVDTKAYACNNATVGEDGVGVVGLGILPSKDRDLIPYIADELISWQNVETAVVFAVIDGNKIEGSIRSVNPSISIPALCHKLAENKYGGLGGGKLGKGAYKYDLHGVFEDIEDDDSKIRMWDLINDKERKRIFKTVRK